MPSLGIHVAIARKYLKKYADIKDEMAFIKWNLDPDLVDDKNISHYSRPCREDELGDSLMSKVGIDEYLKNRDINTDYEKGYFLHLMADFYFYRGFLGKSYINNMSGEEFRKNLYYSYDVMGDYLERNYDIDYGASKIEVEKKIAESQTETNYGDGERMNIISGAEVDEFIDWILEKDVDGWLREFI